MKAAWAVRPVRARPQARACLDKRVISIVSQNGISFRPGGDKTVARTGLTDKPEKPDLLQIQVVIWKGKPESQDWGEVGKLSTNLV